MSYVCTIEPHTALCDGALSHRDSWTKAGNVRKASSWAQPATSISPALRYSWNPPHRRGATQPTRADSPIKVRRVFLRYQHDDPNSYLSIFIAFASLRVFVAAFACGDLFFKILFRPFSHYAW